MAKICLLYAVPRRSVNRVLLATQSPARLKQRNGGTEADEREAEQTPAIPVSAMEAIPETEHGRAGACGRTERKDPHPADISCCAEHGAMMPYHGTRKKL